MTVFQRRGRSPLAVVASVLIIAMLGVGGCALLRPLPSSPGRVRSPSFSSLSSLSSDEVLAGLAQRMDRMRSLRSPYRVSYRSNNQREGFRGAILVRRPDRLRLETLSLVGAIFVLTANGDEIRVLLPRKRVFSRGKSSRANLLRFTRIPLELKELTSLLLGLPPVEVEGPWEGSGSTLVQRFPWGGGQRIEFDPGLGIPFKWDRYDSHGENEITAVFSRFVSTPMGPFPTKISLQYPAQGRSWEIRYQDPEVNVDIPTPFFMLQRPSTFREVPLESFGG